MKPEKLIMVREIMTEFAGLTGLSPAKGIPRRYLWTDAFAVCNFLELFRRTGDERYKNLALSLVDQVHQVLGRHREDDPRTGWISGLDEQEGGLHPTRGGLRIGKKLNERNPTDPFDERLEWDRDGQYYHYLTKWMHALDRVSRVSADSNYNQWAIELAKSAHVGFVHLTSSGQKRMYWKMSIDLSYPLVESMGHHDPLDGFITYNQLRATAALFSAAPALDLTGEIADMEDICKGKDWATDDPLGIGGLLADTYRLAQSTAAGNLDQTGLMEALLRASLVGLESFKRSHSLTIPADHRLAFRELGLAIGLRGVERLKELMEENPGIFSRKDTLHSQIERLMPYTPLGGFIEDFWLDRIKQKAGTWIEHRDINMVMLATALAPDGFLSV
jgi:hypothetical protein